MWGWSASELTTIDSSDNSTLSGYVIQSGAEISNKSVTLSSAGYVYYATCATPKSFYLSGTASKAALAGGFTQVGTFTKYTSSAKTYTLWRSVEKQAAGTYRLDVE